MCAWKVKEMASDPLLSKYGVVMVDETHERSIFTDILLGLLKKALEGGRRNDLKVIITSATLGFLSSCVSLLFLHAFYPYKNNHRPYTLFQLLLPLPHSSSGRKNV